MQGIIRRTGEIGPELSLRIIRRTGEIGPEKLGSGAGQAHGEIVFPCRFVDSDQLAFLVTIRDGSGSPLRNFRLRRCAVSVDIQELSQNR